MFKVSQLLEATAGKFICGSKDVVVKGVSIDSRTIKPQQAFLAIKGVNFDGHNFIEEAIAQGVRVVIVHSAKFVAHSLKYKATFILVKDTTKALGDIAKFQRQRFDVPVIAVTGSNGKTTTKEMLAWVLSKRFKVLKNEGTKNNHIGLPQSLLNLTDSHDLVVLEAGTNHPGELGYLADIARPNIGIITNIGATHLAHFKDLKGVFTEKFALIKKLQSPGIAILNADNDLLKKQLTRVYQHRIMLGVGIKNKSDFSATLIKKSEGKLEFIVNKKFKFKLNSFGFYNIYNALEVIAASRLFGLSYRDIAYRLSNFNFPQNRLQLMELNNIRFINDTYNSNPVSLRQALDALDNFRTKGRKIFVMGDMLELGSQGELLHQRAGIDAAGVCDIFVSVGELSKIAAKAAASRGFDTRNIFQCDSAVSARDILFKKISPGPNDLVLVKGSRGMKMEEIFI